MVFNGMASDQITLDSVAADGTRAAPIDRAYLARFTLGNAALEREVLELFVGQLPIYVEQLRTAATSKDWRQAAHTIKGCALAVGAHKLADAAQGAERVAWDASPGAAPRLQAIEAIVQAADQACGYVACLFATA
jgi:HPt (histidine-containing phosphotransfer) domain-containing protein